MAKQKARRRVTRRTANFVHLRFMPSFRFDRRSVRSIKHTKSGVVIRIACPSGAWTATKIWVHPKSGKRITGKCKVSTRALDILLPRKKSHKILHLPSRVGLPGRKVAANRAPLGSGERFRSLTAKLARRPGVYSPKALSAWIGRRKYGKRRFQALSLAGKRRKGMRVIAGRGLRRKVANPVAGVKTIGELIRLQAQEDKKPFSMKQMLYKKSWAHKVAKELGIETPSVGFLKSLDPNMPVEFLTSFMRKVDRTEKRIRELMDRYEQEHARGEWFPPAGT